MMESIIPGILKRLTHEEFDLSWYAGKRSLYIFLIILTILYQGKYIRFSSFSLTLFVI